jgi:(1->4)-alpha-D-glucan 1-alpha-D-glucosylmutase
LGVSDIYASPIFKARQGSTHGYDVVDPTQPNPELGTTEDFLGLVHRLQEYQMGWLQDIVPNHMAYDSGNPWLMDILENGPNSEFVDFFDIEWNHAFESFRGRILAPLLGNLYGDCLNQGEIQLNYDHEGLTVNYYSLKLPVRIESYTLFLTRNLGQLTKELGRNHPDRVKLLGILYLIKTMPSEAKSRERYDQIAFAKSLLWELYEQNESVRAFLDQNVVEFNGNPGDPASFDALHQLLSEQFYRLSFWKVGAEEINYRRFFTVNELISVRVEEPKVFHKTHHLIEKYVNEGIFTGVRIDHIDGLYDPTDYLKRLREKLGDCYIAVEKILELSEDLPSDWDLQGTSGYDALNFMNGLFCATQNERVFQEIYVRFTGLTTSYADGMIDKKKLIIDRNLGGDMNNLAQKLKTIADQTREGIDFTAYGLEQALVEILACFPVYRTYVASDDVSDPDQTYIKGAIAHARSCIPLLVKEVDFIANLLLRRDPPGLTPEQQQQRLHFVMKFQQLTGPLMAKGVEDTLLYIYNRLLALNEVGGNPGQFGISVERFHTYYQERIDRWPHAMTATATHDTKRGEDMRARLNVLSELPDEWEQQLWTWSELNRSYKTVVGDRPFPDTNDEYFLYQTLLGAFPFTAADLPAFKDRLKDYVIKAVREAKVHTAWLHPDEDYENAYLSFVDHILGDLNDTPFLNAFRPFQDRIAQHGLWNSLAQVVLKYTVPGVPDLYQGTELWDLSLVDPDNRRPVDYTLRQTILNDLQQRASTDVAALCQELLETRRDGRIKLFLTTQLLHARKTHPELFRDGDYHPLSLSGSAANHGIAFARVWQNQRAIAFVPRLTTMLVEADQSLLGECWGDTTVELPSGSSSSWINVMTGQPLDGSHALKVSDILSIFPVALLVQSP